MSAYEPFDQERVLGAPPWKADDPRVVAWEQAHGHDVRLKCYAEFGCLVIEPTLEREIAALRARVAELTVERDAALQLVDDTLVAIGGVFPE